MEKMFSPGVEDCQNEGKRGDGDELDYVWNEVQLKKA